MEQKALFGTSGGAPAKQPKDPIEEMAGALTDPIIVYPAGGWEDTIPEKLKAELPLRRLAHQMECLKGKGNWEEACDLEALIYLYPASLAAPLSERWTRIYLYLGTRCLGASLPEDIRQESLSEHEMRELKDMKRWIYRQKVEARKARHRAGAAPQKAVPARSEQMQFF